MFRGRLRNARPLIGALMVPKALKGLKWEEAKPPLPRRSQGSLGMPRRRLEASTTQSPSRYIGPLITSRHVCRRYLSPIVSEASFHVP